MQQLILRAGRDKRVRAGHTWVYQGEIGVIGLDVKSGDLVEVLDNRGRFMGVGYYSQASQIAVRFLSRERETIDAAFFRRRLQQALAYRRRVKSEASCYRLIYGEGDLLPGLVVDRFEDYLVVQFLTVGMEVNRELLLKLIVEMAQPAVLLSGATNRRVNWRTCRNGPA
jgi:23S rRNA (cytosine1962-C5)-methyltransferase